MSGDDVVNGGQDAVGVDNQLGGIGAGAVSCPHQVLLEAARTVDIAEIGIGRHVTHLLADTVGIDHKVVASLGKHKGCAVRINRAGEYAPSRDRIAAAVDGAKRRCLVEIVGEKLPKERHVLVQVVGVEILRSLIVAVARVDRHHLVGDVAWIGEEILNHRPLAVSCIVGRRQPQEHRLLVIVCNVGLISLAPCRVLDVVAKAGWIAGFDGVQ